MRKAKKYREKSNNSTILLIVENSEVDFFRLYFNRYIKDNYDVSIKCESSGINNKCKITSYDKMSKRVSRAIEKEDFRAVFLMLDLNTKCSKTQNNHTCLVELKKEYLPRYKIKKELQERFCLFVVCNEIESWFLTMNKDTNSPHQNHKKELKDFLNVRSEPQIVAKMIKELTSGRYKLAISKNSSLQHFIEKLKEFNHQSKIFKNI